MSQGKREKAGRYGQVRIESDQVYLIVDDVEWSGEWRSVAWSGVEWSGVE